MVFLVAGKYLFYLYRRFTRLTFFSLAVAGPEGHGQLDFVHARQYNLRSSSNAMFDPFFALHA